VELNEIYNMDCLSGMQEMLKAGQKVDLIVADPPYQIDCTKAGGNTRLARSFQKMNDELTFFQLCRTPTREYFELMAKLQDRINIYIWCNAKQVPFYLDIFVKGLKCSYDILVWHKTNVPPLFSNKYLCDKEMCLYFRKGGYCKPDSYAGAKTIFISPMNVGDKRLYGHPTVKPLPIIERLVCNSSRENEVVLDPLMGSGTTAVVCKKLNRKFIGFEILPAFCESARKRIQET